MFISTIAACSRETGYLKSHEPRRILRDDLIAGLALTDVACGQDVRFFSC